MLGLTEHSAFRATSQQVRQIDIITLFYTKSFDIKFFGIDTFFFFFFFTKLYSRTFVQEQNGSVSLERVKRREVHYDGPSLRQKASSPSPYKMLLGR